MQRLYDDKMQSVIIEGGRKTLDRYISSGLWDEARVLTGNQMWGAGTEAPKIAGGTCVEAFNIDDNRVEIEITFN